MPGPRRKKPPPHHFDALTMPVGVSEVYLLEWFQFGMDELGEYLAKCLAFARYVDERDDFNALD